MSGIVTSRRTIASLTFFGRPARIAAVGSSSSRMVTSTFAIARAGSSTNVHDFVSGLRARNPFGSPRSPQSIRSGAPVYTTFPQIVWWRWMWGNVVYTGAPERIDWGERGDPKGFLRSEEHTSE